jgi:hypothetical protein
VPPEPSAQEAESLDFCAEHHRAFAKKFCLLGTLESFPTARGIGRLFLAMALTEREWKEKACLSDNAVI